MLRVLGIPAVLVLLLYARLLAGPLDVPFAREKAEEAVRAALAENTELALGGVAISLDELFRPVLQFSPVEYTDHTTGASVSMKAMNIGFSPIFALIGQPGATVTLIEPQLQMIQDLLGPRLAKFEIVETPNADQATVQVFEGSEAYPSVGILSEGLSVRGRLPSGGDGIGLRSDNDWLIYNLQASEKSLSEFLVHAREGRFSRLEIRGGSLQMLDPVYSLIRTFTGIKLKVVSGHDDVPTQGDFSAVLAGRTINGTFSRSVDGEAKPHLVSEVSGLDLAAVMPFLDDPDGMMALRGATRLSVQVDYAEQGGPVEGGVFGVDLSGTQLRIRDDLFHVTTGQPIVEWSPKAAQFVLGETPITIGKSSGTISGEFALGLDDVFGPTVAMSVKATDVSIHPNDMAAPEMPFTEVSYSGWSSPLYGAVGIDQMVIRKPGAEMRIKGRLDMVRKGVGVEMEVGGEGMSADDLKRLWPYFLSEKNRDWFVEHVTGGQIQSSSMKFSLPVGILAPDGSDQPLPREALDINLVGSDVTFVPVEGMAPVLAKGETRLRVDGKSTRIQLAPMELATEKGEVGVANAAIILDYVDPDAGVTDISGDVSGQIAALLDVMEQQAPGALEGVDLSFDPHSLTGEVNGSLLATIVYGADNEVATLDYSARGTVEKFSSAEPIADRHISDGNFTFEATPEGYNLQGKLQMDGLPADLLLTGTLEGGPDLKVASTIDASEFTKFGFDVGDLLSGTVRFVGKPLEDGALQITADLTDARLTVRDIGLSKARGVGGTINAEIRQDGTETKVSSIALSFGTVRIAGDLVFDSEKGLISAEFSRFSLSKDDDTKLAVHPIDGGYSVTIRGSQFDLKPMLKRYYALDEGSTGGPQATSVPTTIVVDAKLERALGFYSVTAYNLDLGLRVRGSDLQSVNLQTQFAEGNAVSITTNPTSTGRTMSVALNDAGTLLRFLNVYPRLLGGSGSLVMTTNASTAVDRGQIKLQNFSIVDEDKVKEILGNHSDSRSLIAKENRINFNDATASFIRRSDRIELTDAVLDGGGVGGTIKGFIYTKTRKYDLTGTYIPLFGLNTALQQLPLIGALLGGADGGGLLGVTFAVRGDLDKPQFLINPASLLAPGVFRSIFEFRSKEAPREAPPAQ